MELTISTENVAEYLISHKILDVESIISGGLTIIDSSRRNRNIRIMENSKKGFLIKQPRLTSIGNITTIKKEALVYLLSQTDPDLFAIHHIVPQITDFDDINNILITELIINSTPLQEHLIRSKGDIQKEAAILGKMMGQYHSTFSVLKDRQKLKLINEKSVPPSLVLRPQPEIFVEINPSRLEFLKLMQRDKDFYKSALEALAEWEPKTIIHSDIKFDNILVFRESDKNLRLKIVDWEAVSLGDPAWDIACVLQEFIRLWIDFFPSMKSESVNQLISKTDYPLQKLQPSIRAFWGAYVEKNKMPKSQSHKLLLKSVVFSAMRMMQSVYESLASAQIYYQNLTYMIQISFNILKNPYDAIIYLFGIPLQDYSI